MWQHFHGLSRAVRQTRMESTELAHLLERLGCPSAKAPEMAQQLDKRARQLSMQQNRTYGDALTHLLKLMQQGWAAQPQAPNPSQP